MSVPPSDKRAALEAVLFAAPDPVPVERLARLLQLEAGQVQALLDELEEEYRRPERGFMLERVAGGVRLCSKPEYFPYLEELGREVRSGGLSQAALETLAIIAYRQPITRPQIEAIRGVRVDSAIASLLERGLIEEKGRSDGVGRPILYGTTSEFLVRFKLNSLADLPPLPKLEERDEDAAFPERPAEAGS